MLSYIFPILKNKEYKSIETEAFENNAELLASILIRGVTFQLKRGLNQEYISTIKELSTIRGKLEIQQSLCNNTVFYKKIVCSYDEFSVNTKFNIILKSTLIVLLQSNISVYAKKQLKRLLCYFKDIDIIRIKDLKKINWNNIKYNRNNKTYELLISICNLILDGLIPSNINGKYKFMDFLDDRKMNYIYEKFILEYYHKEFPNIKVSAPVINWQIDNNYCTCLPIMKTDVMLEYNKNILIIDAKYYNNILKDHYNKKVINSSNLYQIFAYVKNKQIEIKEKNYKVSGMLLYAKNDEDIDNIYIMSGNIISVKTLDLNADFNVIKSNLNGIINDYLHFI
jgi:5-methylcytosine-specific restriction enzyme subunit McrC